MGRSTLAALVRSCAELVHNGASVVHHRACLACDAPGPSLCGRCMRTMGPPFEHLPGCWVAGRYDGDLRRAILAYKRRGWLALERPLGGMLAGALLQQAAVLAAREREVPVVLVPVPPHRQSLRERGVDAVHRLARCAAASLCDAGLQVTVRGMLVLTREYDRSSAGGAGERRSVEGAFACRVRQGAGLGPDPVVIVIDDVITTGATMREAARALAACGIRLQGATAIAGTERRRPAR